MRSRIEPELKASASNVLALCGLSLSDGIRLFLRQMVTEQGLPFEIKVPNATTRKAMLEVEAVKRGRFKSAQELFDDLNKNSQAKTRRPAKAK